MSVNVENINTTLEKINDLSASIDGMQEQTQKAFYNACDLVGDKVVEQVEQSVQMAEQLQVQAKGLLEQADAVIKEAANPELAQSAIDSISNVAANLTFEAHQKLAEAGQLLEQSKGYIEHVKETASKAAEEAGWGEMLLMTGIGFAIVFVVLVLLIFIMKGMGVAFTRQKKAEKVAKAAAAGVTLAEEDHHEAITDQEIAAAIITALKLYKSNLHDQESEMLTIHRITRAYSPWSSKIHGLTQLPERK